MIHITLLKFIDNQTAIYRLARELTTRVSPQIGWQFSGLTVDESIRLIVDEIVHDGDDSFGSSNITCVLINDDLTPEYDIEVIQKAHGPMWEISQVIKPPDGERPKQWPRPRNPHLLNHLDAIDLMALESHGLVKAQEN